MIIHIKTSLPETDSYIAPENEWFEDDVSFWGQRPIEAFALSFRECTPCTKKVF